MKAHQPLIEYKIFYKMIGINDFNAYRDIHATKNKFKCKICFKTFKTSSNFKIHVKTHNKIFKCENCNKMFRSSTILRTHLRDYQENPKSFECEICDRNFNMKFFQELMPPPPPSQKMSFKCQRCDYATDIKAYLKIHQKFHENQDKKFAAMKNPLKCQECQTFHQNKTLLK